MIHRKSLASGYDEVDNRGLMPNGTHFVNFEPQCASMRAGLQVITRLPARTLARCGSK